MTENNEQSRKKIVLINTVLYGSTGRIVKQLRQLAEEQGMDAYTVTAYARKNKEKVDSRNLIIGNYFDRYLHIWLSRVTGLSGIFSVGATYKLIRRLNRIDPDVIHLHNLHNAYINLPILFKYIKKHDIKTIWTLHDCWAFTGRCPYFDMVNCEKWRDGCGNCPYPGCDYPIANRDRTSRMWNIKKHTFIGVKNLSVITPSKWLAELAKESFLGGYPVRVINNGIDLSVFKPTYGDVYNELRAQGDKIVLGLAMDWNKRKGLDVFLRLSRMLNDDYRIVMVGTDDALASELSAYNIRCINRTSSQQELAEIYTAADVFVNPTREDNFPTVNIEAIACGAPVVTFNTGGSPEMLDKLSGVVIEKDDINALAQAITMICEDKVFDRAACVERASCFDKNDRFAEYIELY